MSWTERPYVVLCALAALLALQISPWWFPVPDGAAYLSIARSLARGGPITSFGNSQLGFPIGYPILISPAFWISNRPFLLLSVEHWMMATAFMLGVYHWARRQVPDAALLITVLVVGNVEFCNHYRRTLSELSFMMVMIWTVNMLNTLGAPAPGRQARSAARDWTKVLLAGASLVLLIAIREAGIAFAIGFAAMMITRADVESTSWKRVLTTFILIGATGVVTATVVRPERLIAAWSDLTTRASLLEGPRLRVSETGRLLIPGMFKSYGPAGKWLDINMVVYVPVFIGVLTGWWGLVRQKGEVFSWSFPFYLLLHFFWPYDAGPRYLLPLLPLLVLCLWRLFEPLQAQRRKVFAIAAIAHLSIAVGYWAGIDLPRARKCAADWPAVEQLADRIAIDARPVGMVDAPLCTRLMLSLAIDRTVPLDDAGGAGQPGVRWVVTPAQSPVPRGFKLDSRAGAYKLVARQGE